jgi:ElaB/YqjD/DUF883 family membrane-anchored ribosome-binding protein
MAATETRSKREIAADIQRDRQRVGQLVSHTRETLVDRNPGILAWKKTRATVQDCKRAVAAKTQAADRAVRANVYKGIGLAVAAGAVAGFIVRWRLNRRAR